MNVKTIFLMVSTSLIILVLVGMFFLRNEHEYNDIDCATTIDLSLNDDGETLTGHVSMVLHFNDSGSSYISEYGEITYNNYHYILDRNVMVKFQTGNRNGYAEVTRENIDKNKTDTVPDDVMEKIMSSQSVFFLKKQKLLDNVYRLKGLRRTALICIGN
jgi:hypothetical protein